MIRADAAAVSLLALTVGLARAHDDWVQLNTNLVRPGDQVFIDLMLGNHGNDHRDFKLAGKLNPAAGTLEVVGPGGKRYDVKDRLADLGYTPTEGFWNTRFAPAEEGLYLVAHVSDQVVSYAPTRSVKSGKTFFVASRSLDKVSRDYAGHAKPLGHALELVPLTHPVTPMGPGTPLKVQLLYHGKPLAKARVSFVPRGETLTKEFDPRYERLTDDKGQAEFTPGAGNYYLVVAHVLEPKEGGKGHESTKYSATLTVLVPQVCPCCGE
jgi:uncharacterized GH25 family protein